MSRTTSDADKSATDSSRRQFMKTLGVAGSAVAVASVAGEAAAEVVEQPAEQPAKSQGYQKTEHVRAYYDSARI